MTGLSSFTAPLTDNHQTTIPTAIRQALGLGKRDKIRFVLSEGRILLENASRPAEDDPVFTAFLDFAERDMLAHPDRILPLDPGTLARMDTLVGHLDVDPDAPLADDRP